MTVPDVPFSAMGKMTDAELADLWRQLCTELMNEKYQGRTHGNRRTRDAGCDGPLCKKAQRDYGRRRYTLQGSSKFMYSDLILVAWFPVAQRRLAQARQMILEKIAPAS